MTTLTVLPSGNSFGTVPGTTLLAALKAAGEPIQHKCQAGATCGSCHVYVLEGRKSLSRISPLENSRLDAIVGVSSRSRLACQTVLGSEPVTVELLGFV